MIKGAISLMFIATVGSAQDVSPNCDAALILQNALIFGLRSRVALPEPPREPLEFADHF
jgi:hypothetical protein